MKIDRLPLNSKPLDTLLDGGLEYSSITNVYGPPGSGKTNLALVATLSSVNKGKKVIFIDTEGGFSIERLSQLAGNVEEVSKNIILIEPKDFKDQHKQIKKLRTLLNKEDIGLIVFDSLVTLYRLESDSKNISETNRKLAKQLSTLSLLSREKNIPVLMTNQVYSNFETKNIELVSRDVAKYSSKCLIELKKIENNRRLAILRKHRSLPEGKEIEFEITNNGLEEPKKLKLF